MASISKTLHSAIIQEIANNPEKYTGSEEENIESAAKETFINNPNAFQPENPVDALMLETIQMD